MPGGDFQSTGRYIRIRFTSDGSVSGDGFTIHTPGCHACASEVSSSDGHFLITSATMRFSQADAHCGQHGRRVATTTSSDQDQMLGQLLACGSAWIGLTDAAHEGQFVWTDGASTSHRHWNSGEPNNSGGEDCVEVATTGRWNDLACSTARRVICGPTTACDPGHYQSGSGCQACQPGETPQFQCIFVLSPPDY